MLARQKANLHPLAFTESNLRHLRELALDFHPALEYKAPNFPFAAGLPHVFSSQFGF